MSVCPRCNAPLAHDTRFCSKCGTQIGGETAPQAMPAAPQAMPAAPGMAAAPYAPGAPATQMSSLAIWSFVCGLLSMVCLGILTGIPSIVMGIMSLLRINKSNGRLTGSGFAISGIVLGAVGFVLLGPMMVAIAIPGFLRAREVSCSRSCQENLVKIEGAKEQYALDRNIVDRNVTPTWNDLVGATLYLKRTPVCIMGGTYNINDLGHNPECTYQTPPWLGSDRKFLHKMQ
ncbi:MAG: DUF4190 domain-containing protein [Candidatus Sumerlaeota bacterium]|nr:DUF4190 domain-containing protein [Candidatus Sumerlaeota bacterium]